MKLIKKFVASLLSLVMVLSFSSVAFAATPETPSDEQWYTLYTTIPENAEILQSTETLLYFNANTCEQITEAQSKSLDPRELFVIKADHTSYQMPGGKIDFGIELTATSTRCRIKKISGSVTQKDQNSSASSTFSIRQSALVPDYHFGAYFNGKKSFTVGHTVKVSWNYYITLVSGSILNGGRMTGSHTTPIVG